MAVPSPEAALALLALAGERIGDGISAFEIMHRQGLDFLDEAGMTYRDPFADRPDWMVLIDVGLPRGLSPDDALTGLFEAALEAELVFDGVIAQSQSDRGDFWKIREDIPLANRAVGSISSHDISVPLGEVPAFIRDGNAALAELGDLRINCFGHLGDGNLHYNVFPAKGHTKEDYLDLRPQIKKTVHDLAHACAGSVSAEHGIGRLKVDDLETYSDPAKLAMIRAIKTALDPQGIMNPGVIVRV